VIKQIQRKKHSTHFELLECSINSILYRLFVIYRPHPSRSNKLKTTRFFEEWLDFLDYSMHIPEEIIITCDLNFHLDNNSDCDGCKFIEMLNDRGLAQHVNGATL
jgi:hypothetical protein